MMRMRVRSKRTHWLLLAMAGVVAQPVSAVTDTERLQTYRDFRTYFDSRDYQQALPLAERLVEQTEEQYGEKARELVNPLTNLGTVHHRLGNHQSAETSYERGVEILEASTGSTDRALLLPLQGLGETYNALGQHEDARLVLKRAVDLSRNLDGLFNLEQLKYVEPLIDSYVALAQFTDAEKEHQYAFRVAETAYGRNDVRMIGPIDRYARWFEFIGRYSTARALHGRALSIADRQGKNSPLSVDALRGIARTYRLEFLNGPEEESRDSFSSSANTAVMPSDIANAQRLNADGERALRMALTAIDAQQPINRNRRGETLVELGDWYLSAGETSKALETYKEAWKELELSGSTAMLSAPRQLAYRPPSASISRSRIDPKDAEERYVEVRFTVSPEGRVSDIETASSDAPTGVQKSVVNAVKKARYSPRLESGEPAATTGVTLRERVMVKRKDD
jgi:TonB family protein